MDTKTFLYLLISIQCAEHVQAQIPQNCNDSSSRCQDDLCVDINFSCKGVLDCFHDPLEDKRLRGACETMQYECANKRCVPREWLCDSENDCGDSSDERDCRPNDLIAWGCSGVDLAPYTKALEKYKIKDVSFTCKRCIPLEHNSSSVDLKIYPAPDTPRHVHIGSEVVFQCRDEGGKQVPVRWVRKGGRPFKPGTIDRKGRLEIMDATVEDSGIYICQTNLHSGYSGSEARVTLIVNSPHAEGIRDAMQYECENKRCVKRSWLCDTEDDCGDGSDERTLFIYLFIYFLFFGRLTD